MSEGIHHIEVVGRWHNDSTAGVYVWCNTCDSQLLEGDDYGDRLTPEQIADAVAAHRTRSGP